MPLPLPHRFRLLSLLLLCNLQLTAQEPLPAFEVRDIGSGRIVISWFNQYPYTAQISIQRSFDSLRGYKSILTVPDPSAIQNGFADTKATNDHMFYRLYILLDKGQYFFTAPKRPIKQPASTTAPRPATPAASNSTAIAPANTPPQPAATEAAEEEKEVSATAAKTSDQYMVKKVEPIVIKLDPSKMGDSARTPFTVSPQNDPDAYAPSLYVYAQADGNIRIDVPNKKRYSGYRIRFYEADKQFLFELKQLPAPSFQLDKTNFLHSGWFLFELYEESRLIERHKVFLEKDF
ncbi:MAG: hypothetical protein KGO46_02195 [Bacteroidetes bacterium]|nr:hypothetical protein [Bacteroidota bacterium]